MTVRELIAILQQMPQDVPVTLFNDEQVRMSEVTTVEHADKYRFWREDGTRYVGPYVEVS